MKKILLLILFPIAGYSQGVEKLQRITMSSANEQIVISQRESLEFLGDYNSLKSSLMVSLENFESCNEEVERYKKLAIQNAIEIEKLSLENDKLKNEIEELRKLKDMK
jgi:cell shape-determining protein MreC